MSFHTSTVLEKLRHQPPQKQVKQYSYQYKLAKVVLLSMVQLRHSFYKLTKFVPSCRMIRLTRCKDIAFTSHPNWSRYLGSIPYKYDLKIGYTKPSMLTALTTKILLVMQTIIVKRILCKISKNGVCLSKFVKNNKNPILGTKTFTIYISIM